MSLPKPLAQFLVFLTGSGVGAVIDYVLTLMLVYGLEMDVKTALAVSMCVSAVVVFFFHHRFTFDPSGETRLILMLARFLALAVVIYGLRALILWLTQGLFPVPIQLAIALGVVSVINFAASKALVFKS